MVHGRASGTAASILLERQVAVAVGAFRQAIEEPARVGAELIALAEEVAEAFGEALQLDRLDPRGDLEAGGRGVAHQPDQALGGLLPPVADALAARH